MFLVGIGGASALGILYLIFRKPSKTKFKFVPVKNSGLQTIPEEMETASKACDGSKLKSEPQFELNSF